MTDIAYLGDNEAEAVKVVVSTLPSDTPYKVVNHGQDNLIILAAGDVYRFPRNKIVWDRAGVEHFVLETLREYPELPVPMLKHLHENPAYTVARALDGEVLENQDIRNLSADEQHEIGEQIGTFAYRFHALFKPEEIRQFLSEKNPQAWYEKYLDQILRTVDGTNPYDALASWVLAEWPRFDHSEGVVIHDDLHVHNMLFDNSYRLTGVLDFGDVNIGNPEQDLRYVYWMGDDVFDGAVEAYEQLSGKMVSRDLIKLCAISQEVSGLYDPSRAYMRDRAKSNLSFRFPELDH